MLTKVEISIEHRQPVAKTCTLLSDCVVEEGSLKDYMAMSQWHYRNTGRPPGLRQVYRARYKPDGSTVAVVVFAAPSLSLAVRNVAIPNRYTFGVGSKLMRGVVASRVNQEIDLLMRIVVHPIFRSTGLAVKLLQHTLPKRPHPFVESSASMGAINPFFVRAGMREYIAPPSDVSARILGALRSVGVTEQTIANPSALLRDIESMPAQPKGFIVAQLLEYERRWMRVRTGRKLTITLEGAVARVASNALIRPRYYLWRNEALIPRLDNHD